MFNDFFDKVFVITIDSEELKIADCLLKEQGIEYEVFEGIKDNNGIKGLVLSMRKLFHHCLQQGYENVVILEDDADWLVPNSQKFIAECLPQLPKDYHCFYLGLNLTTQPKRISQNILQVNTAYSSHAVCYSRSGIEFILPLLMKDEIEPYDILLMKWVQPVGKCYATMPMLCTQRTRYSQIEKKVVDWRTMMANTYNMHTKKLQSMANEIAQCIGSHKINGYEITVDPNIFEMQHPELIGQVCDCKRFVMAEEECGCTVKEWRVVWKENTNQ